MSNASIGLQHEALAWLRQARGVQGAPEPLAGKQLVIKLGGSTLATQRPILQACLWLQALGAQLVLVHGGGSSINTMLTRLHLPVQFKDGLRLTDAATLEIVRMVLCGQVNQELVSLASSLGGKVVGLSGTDGQMIRACLLDPALGFVGKIDAVSPDLLHALLVHGYLPIIAPVGHSQDGMILNVNADSVATALAQAIHAEMLLFLCDVAGLKRADGSVIASLSAGEAFQLLQEGVIAGGMIPKVEAALEAVQAIPFVQMIDGARPQDVLQAVLWHEGGTRFLRQEDESPGTKSVLPCKEQKGNDPSFVCDMCH